MIVKMRDCPFCGSSATLIKDPLWSESGRGYRGAYCVYVQCTNPKCMVKLPYGKSDSICRTEEEATEVAIARWNGNC